MNKPATSDRKPSSFRVDQAILRNKDAAMEFIGRSGLPKPEQDFLTEIILFSEKVLLDNPNHASEPVEFAFGEFQDWLDGKDIKGTSRKAVRRKAFSLCEADLMSSTERSFASGGRPARIFTLKPIHKESVQSSQQRELEEHLQGHRNTRTKTTRAILKHLRESDAQMIKHFHKSRSVTETLFTGVLDRAMRFTTFEKVENNRITNSFRIKKAKVTVMATTQTGPSSELATLADQRVIRAVITEIAHYIESSIQENILRADVPRQSSLFGDSEDEFYFDDIGPSDITVDESGVSGIETNRQRYEHLEADAIERIHNSFFIDVVSLAKRMDYASPSSSSVRRLINSSLRRLYDTNFRLMIDASDTKKALDVMNLFDLDDFVTDFRFLTVLKSQYEKGFIEGGEGDDHSKAESVHTVPGNALREMTELEMDEQRIDPYNPDELKRVRVWRLSLDPHLFSRLLDKETRALYTAHPDIMKEGSGLAQTLYNLFTQTIGRSNRQLKGQAENVFSMSLKDLHNLLWPTRTYSRFEVELVELVKRYTAAENWDASLTLNSTTMFGYRFTLMRNSGEEGRLWLRVERDRADPLAGDQSYHNRTLAAGSAPPN